MTTERNLATMMVKHGGRFKTTDAIKAFSLIAREFAKFAKLGVQGVLNLTNVSNAKATTLLLKALNLAIASLRAREATIIRAISDLIKNSEIVHLSGMIRNQWFQQKCSSNA